MPSLYGAVKSKTGELLQDSMEYCKGALQSVSRSFALTIPLVEENILGPIMVGYLEARILDTFEASILAHRQLLKIVEDLPLERAGRPSNVAGLRSLCLSMFSPPLHGSSCASSRAQKTL